MWKTRFYEHWNYWLTFLSDTHILKTAKGNGDYPMSKTKTPEMDQISGVFLFRYVGGLCLRLLCCLFVFSVQPFANVVANYIYCDRDKD